MIKNPNIDIGLAALCKHAKPGQLLTSREIADVCGVSHQCIWQIEEKAKQKVKAQLIKKYGHIQNLLETQN